MKKFLIILILFFSYTSYSQLASVEEYNADYAFDRAKQFILDSIIGSPGINIKRIYGTSLFSDVKVTLKPFPGEPGKVTIVLGILEQLANVDDLVFHARGAVSNYLIVL